MTKITEKMTKLLRLTTLIPLLISSGAYTQTISPLQQKIEQIVSSKNAVVGVAVSSDDGRDTLGVNSGKQFPMQSVFKFPIALAMLSEIDRGHFSFDQKVEIQKKQLLPGLWSPIREKYPEGATLSIAEILEYTVSQSDNAGCDALLRLLGEPRAVENYFRKNNFRDISIKINEEVMQNNWDLQFSNWTTPKEADRILRTFYDNGNKLLSEKSYGFIWKTMKATETGKDRLRGQLPKGTIVAHKTGYSGINKTTGITAAVNDIGIVFLPNGKHFFISVFVTESKENPDANEKIISDIAKATWDYFIEKQ